MNSISLNSHTEPYYLLSFSIQMGEDSECIIMDVQPEKTKEDAKRKMANHLQKRSELKIIAKDLLEGKGVYPPEGCAYCFEDDSAYYISSNGLINRWRITKMKV